MYINIHKHKKIGRKFLSIILNLQANCQLKLWTYQEISVLAASDLLMAPNTERRIIDDPKTLMRPRQNGRHFPDDIFKCIFLNENALISISISLKFVPKGSINNFPALVEIMAWRLPGDKPLSEPTVFSLLTHVLVKRPQWVNLIWMRAKVTSLIQCPKRISLGGKITWR